MSVNRLAALLLVVWGSLLCGSSHAAPTPSANPVGEEMELIFADDFDGAALDKSVWESAAYEQVLKHETARGPGNLEVKDGELRLYVRKETRQVGKQTVKWTAGSVYTRKPVENNVFIEARFKPGQASGVNNAFWLACTTEPKTSQSNHYEIDIVETRQDAGTGRPTGKGHLAWHDWKTMAYATNSKGARDHIAQGVQVEHSFDEYHVWGLWYGESEMIFYLDGKEVWRGSEHPRYLSQWRTGVGKFKRWFPNEEKRAYGRFGQEDWSYLGGYTGDRMNILFSNLPWGEKWSPLTDAADGTYMAVDYVRVYKPRRLTTAVPLQFVYLGKPDPALKVSGSATADNGSLILRPDGAARVTLQEPFSLDSRYPRYFSMVARNTDAAALHLAFQSEAGSNVCVAGIGSTNQIFAGFDSLVSTADAYPAKERHAPFFTNDKDYLLVVRLTPAAGKEQDAVSVSAFPLPDVPAREPFFYRNIDRQGNTSVNNQWHINARHASAAVLRGVLIENTGRGSASVRDLRVGTSFPSVLPMK
jgi:hypothetical protein